MTVKCCICLESFKKRKDTSRGSSVASSSKHPDTSKPAPAREYATLSSSQQHQHQHQQQQQQQEDVFSTDDCDHHVCRACLAQYLWAYVQKPRIDGDYSALGCPELDCNHTYNIIGIIDKVMPCAEAVLGWWRTVIEKTIMDSVGHCPYPDCQGSFELPDVYQQQRYQSNVYADNSNSYSSDTFAGSIHFYDLEDDNEASSSSSSSSSRGRNFYNSGATMVNDDDYQEEGPVFAECLECNRANADLKQNVHQSPPGRNLSLTVKRVQKKGSSASASYQWMLANLQGEMTGRDARIAEKWLNEVCLKTFQKASSAASRLSASKTTISPAGPSSSSYSQHQPLQEDAVFRLEIVIIIHVVPAWHKSS
ncbi:hypothetical protein BDB00DRAFT_877562 [Zychaea mexicana]|uniref:uncharacterized protein n=1 Tax=Zychaea mexicana TaxID=64656 RepID=UPI0022FEAD45|nr:uncharacterized protein BDB00DRAFT_877562 [Zychaea mexicana]KAI9488343.1 hypothetical protein BDB00DRAFT_877562 [Zychaea mexicana]